MNYDEIKLKVKQFAHDRNWDQYHSPKNLSMALAGEAGELLEIFQWLTEEQSRKESISAEDKQLASEELADIQIYLIRLCDQLDVDLEGAVEQKIKQNAEKYPVHLAKDNATKYNRRETDADLDVDQSKSLAKYTEL